MDKITYHMKNLSLRKSLALYVVFFILLALLLSAATAFFCNNAITDIRDSYPPSGEKYYLTNEQGEQLGDGTYIGGTVSFSQKDERRIAVLEVLPTIAAFIYSALCIMAAVLLFYQQKLKKPLAELQVASEKIASNDLNFSLHYQSNDELGQLCSSFELMRSMLAKNFSEMWRQVEERKQINAAFAHDLRTPLTVIKGYNEILQTSENTATRETADIMGKHIVRMESYVSSMSNLRRLEDAQPDYKLTDLQPFLFSLYESAKIVCARYEKTLYLQNEVAVSRLSVDIEFISQVFDNLISNAVRYANNSITLSFKEKDGVLLLSVEDDGKGFDNKSLCKAANPYFTEEENRSEHFGLGLYISKLLCEHHGGYLQIENTINGAKVTAFFKSNEL